MLGSSPNNFPVHPFSRSLLRPVSKLPLVKASCECKNDDSEEHDVQILNFEKKYPEFLPGANQFNDRQIHDASLKTNEERCTAFSSLYDLFEELYLSTSKRF